MNVTGLQAAAVVVGQTLDWVCVYFWECGG